MTALVPTFQVVARMRPLLEKTEQHCFPAFMSIADVLRDLGVLQASKFLRYTVQDSGIPIHSSEWDSHRPGPGALLAVRAVAMGGAEGDGGKDIARLVGAIAAIAAGNYVGGLAALGSVGGPVLGAVTSSAVLWGSEKLIGPPDQDQLASAPTPELNVRNRAAPYGAEPRIHGRMRVYPPFASLAYHHSYSGINDVILLYTFGPGPLRFSHVKIGEVDIGDIGGINVDDPQSYDVVTGNGVDVRTISPPILTQSVFPGGDYVIPPSGSYTFTILTDQYTSEAICKFACHEGLAVRVNDDATYQEDGWPQPHPLRGKWIAINSEIKVEADCYTGGDWVGWQEVYLAGRDHGDRVIEYGNEGGYKAFAYRFNLMRDFSQDDPTYYRFRFTRTHERINWPEWLEEEGYGVLAADQYTEHDTMWLVGIDSVEWSDAIKEEQMDPEGGVHIASIGIRIPYEKAETIQWDKFNCIVESRIHHWNGSDWTFAYTKHPEAMFRDVLQGDSLNAGAHVADARIDLDSLQDWGAWCMANGYTFNGIWDRNRTVRQALTAICAVGRATPVMIDGKYGVHWDRQQDTPVQHFSPRNSWGFSAVRRLPNALHGIRGQFISQGADSYLHTERIIFKDGFTGANASNIQKMEFFGVTGENQIDLLSWYHINCAYLRLETHKREVDMENLVCTRGDPVTISDDVPMIGNKRGRIKDVTYGIGGDVTHVLLDEPVEIDSADYLLRVRCHNAPNAPYRYSMRTPKLVNVGGWVTTVQFTTPIPTPTGTTGQPAPEDWFAFGEEVTPDVLIERWYLVLGIEPHEDLSATVTLIEEASGREDPATTGVYDPGTEASYQPDTQNEPWPDKLDPQTPVIVEGRTGEGVLYWGNDGMLHSRIVLTIAYESGYFAAVHQVEVQYRLHPAAADEDQVPWIAANTFAGPVAEVDIRDVVDNAFYDTRVRTRSVDDRVSPWAVAESIRVIGKTTPPPDPQNLTLEDGRLLRWAYKAPPLDLAGFEIRRHSGDSPGWDRAKPVNVHPVAGNMWAISPQLTGTYTFYVKALDLANPPNYSVNAASLTVTVGDPDDVPNLEADPIYDWQDHNWPGTVENGTVISGEIRQDNQALPMIYTSTWWNGFAADGYWDAVMIAVTDVVAEGDSWWIEYQITGADSENTWHSWPGRMSLRPTLIGAQMRISVRYRITVGRSTSQGKIKQLNLTRGYPVMAEKVQLEWAGGGATVLELRKKFTHLIEINGTICERGGGTFAAVHAVSLSQGVSDTYDCAWYIAKCYSSAGAPGHGKARWMVYGYRSYLGPDYVEPSVEPYPWWESIWVWP